MAELRLKPEEIGKETPRAEVIESSSPEELRTPETAKEQMLQTIEEGQTRWKRFLNVMRELPKTMRNLAGGGGMEGFRTRGVRGVYTALRLAMMLGGTAEAFKSMASTAQADQESDLDKMVELSKTTNEHGSIGHHPSGLDEEHVTAGRADAGVQKIEFTEVVHLGEMIIPLDSHQSATETQKHIILSKEQVLENHTLLKQLVSRKDLHFFVREFDATKDSQEELTNFSVGKSDIKEMSAKPQVLNGVLESITAHVDPRVLSAPQRILFENFLKNRTMQLRDPYGNTVIPQADGSIKVFIPYDFDAWEKQVQGQQAPALTEIKMDFSLIGLGKFEGSLYSQPPQHLGVVGEGNYHVWSSASIDTDSPEGKQSQQELLETVSGYARGVANLETFFGFVPGTVAKRFHVVPAIDENASAQDESTSEATIMMTIADTYRYGRKMDPEIFGQHEGSHLLGDKLHHVDQSDAWKAFYDFSSNEANRHLIGKEDDPFEKEGKRVDTLAERHAWLDKVEKEKGLSARKFIENAFHATGGESTINEKDFYNLFTTGGHAFDNSLELFASQVNSLLDPDWESKMLAPDKSEQFIRWQLQALETLRGLFKDQKKIRDDAPVFDSLNAKIVFLQKLLKVI